MQRGEVIVLIDWRKASKVNCMGFVYCQLINWCFSINFWLKINHLLAACE